ncbi:MAG TPA: hypothetical protein VIO57_11050 [Chloroflexota bacterium]
MTLAGGVSDLLARGLEAAANEDSIKGLEQSLGELRAQLSDRDHTIQEVRDRVAAAEARAASMRELLSQLDGAPIGRCRHAGCAVNVTAIDLVVRRACRNGHSMTHVLEQAGKAPGLDPGEWIVAVAALGLVLGLLASGAKK